MKHLFLTLTLALSSQFALALPPDGLTVTSAPASHPWYASWWFIVLALAVIAGICFTLYIFTKKSVTDQADKEKQQAKNGLDNEKFQYMFNVNNELKTPLMLISGPLERMLQSGSLNPTDYARVKSMYKQATRMRALLNTIQSAATSQGKKAVNLTPTVFNNWVRSVSEEFNEEASSRGVVIRLDLDPNIGNVPLDEEKAHIVLSNLIMNGISHSLEHTDLLVRTEYYSETGSVRVTVSDRGTGISEADLSKLLEPADYSKANNSTYGIGLAFSKNIIEQLGGTLSAYNNKYGGAAFYFEIPSGRPAYSAPDTRPVITKDVNPNSNFTTTPQSSVIGHDIISIGSQYTSDVPIVTDLSEATLLIVEDDLDLQEYLKAEFEGSVKKLFQAHNGVEAIEVLNTHDVSVIVSDVMMPEMDGFSLCRYVKTTVSISHIPVILLTARGDEQSRVIGYKNGADDYITKPFELNVLIDSINKLFLSRELVRKRYTDSHEPAPTAVEATFSSADEMFMRNFDALIKENISNPELDVMYIVNKMSTSRTVLFNKIKQLTGMNLQNYINKHRMDHVIELMKTTNLPLAEVAEKSGFSSPRYFSTAFKNYTGKTPSQYKKDCLNP